VLWQVYVCCLAALQLDSTIAPAVAQTADRIIRQALGGPLSQLLHVALLTGGAPPPPLALLLRLHCAAHRCTCLPRCGCLVFMLLQLLPVQRHTLQRTASVACRLAA